MPRLLHALVLALGLFVALPGCPPSLKNYDVPPPPHEEIVVVRPGYVWARGHWVREPNHWVWKTGSYELARPGYTYVDGHYEMRGNTTIWVDGTWQRQATGVVQR
jgi:hypothetical protein